MLKVSGCSGKAFNVSSRSRAGMATLPLSLASTGKVAVMVVSRSLAVTVNCLPSMSNRKLSRIGQRVAAGEHPLEKLQLLEKGGTGYDEFHRGCRSFLKSGKVSRAPSPGFGPLINRMHPLSTSGSMING